MPWRYQPIHLDKINHIVKPPLFVVYNSILGNSVIKLSQTIKNKYDRI